MKKGEIYGAMFEAIQKGEGLTLKQVKEMIEHFAPSTGAKPKGVIDYIRKFAMPKWAYGKEIMQYIYTDDKFTVASDTRIMIACKREMSGAEKGFIHAKTMLKDDYEHLKYPDYRRIFGSFIKDDGEIKKFAGAEFNENSYTVEPEINGKFTYVMKDNGALFDKKLIDIALSWGGKKFIAQNDKWSVAFIRDEDCNYIIAIMPIV